MLSLCQGFWRPFVGGKSLFRVDLFAFRFTGSLDLETDHQQPPLGLAAAVVLAGHAFGHLERDEQLA